MRDEDGETDKPFESMTIKIRYLLMLNNFKRKRKPEKKDDFPSPQKISIPLGMTSQVTFY